MMHETKQKQTRQGGPPEASGFSRQRTILISALLAPGAGLAASLLAVVTMGILRVWAGIPTPVELFGDFTLKHIDVHTFVNLLRQFAPNPKTGPLSLALLGMIALGTALGWLYALLVGIRLPAESHRPQRREWLIALAFTLVMTLAGTILFWAELSQNFFGLPQDWSRDVSILGLLAEFVIYGVVLCLAYRLLLPTRPQPNADKVAHSRREWLARGGVAALSVGAAAGTFGLVQKYLSNYSVYDGIKTTSDKGRIVHPITPNSEHYVVTQNTVDPTVDIGLWRLEVDGMVKQPGSYTYEELQKLPSTSRAITLECIANNPAGNLIGTAIWHGVELSKLIDLHGGAQSGATHVAFYSVDNYTISLPIQEVLEANALLAWNMNGTEIPTRHGYPLRVLIPGRYGEENPKWLTRVELTDHFVSGLYADQGWSNKPLHTISRVDYPKDTVPVGQATEVSGLAFAGNRGIQKVEVSVDNGATWQTATLDPAISPDTWVFWKWTWQPTTKGSYTLLSRATDGTGTPQISTKQGTVPNGATGYVMVPITVA